MEKEDRDLIKKLGLKFKGANGCPIFRSYRPGYLPWFVTAEETRFLAYVVSQTLHVANRYLGNPKMLDLRGLGDDYFFIRKPITGGSSLVWEDQIRQIKPPRLEQTDAVIAGDIIRVLRFELGGNQLEADLVMLPAMVGKKGVRPRTAYGLVLADSESGFILGFEFLTVLNSFSDVYLRAPNILARLMADAEMLPQHIVSRNGRLLDLLVPLAAKLRIDLRYSSELPNIDQMMKSMTQWIGGGRSRVFHLRRRSSVV